MTLKYQENKSHLEAMIFLTSQKKHPMSHLMDAINLTLSRDLSESPLVGSKNFMKQPTTAKIKQMVLFQHPFSKLSFLVPFMFTAVQQNTLSRNKLRKNKQIRTSLRYMSRILHQKHTKHVWKSKSTCWSNKISSSPTFFHFFVTFQKSAHLQCLCRVGRCLWSWGGMADCAQVLQDFNHKGHVACMIHVRIWIPDWWVSPFLFGWAK